MTFVENSYKFSGGNIKVTCQFNKRIINCFMYIKFKTSEKSLLYNILRKYIHEKVLFNGCNAVNEITSAYATTNGIFLSCSEKKLIPNIINIYSYVMKTKLTTKECQQLSSKSADFKKLHGDIKTIEVFITGKARNFIKALSNSKDKKIEKLTTGLSNIEPKDIDTIDVKTPVELTKVPYKSSNKEKIDLSIILEDSPFVFDGDNVVLIDNCSKQIIKDKLRFEYGLSKVKSFFNSCGSIGTPSANDSGQKNFKAKCKYILECINILSFMISDIHGFSFEVKSTDFFSECGLNADSRAKIKDMLKAVSKN